jgi:hypothetical protein
MVSRTSTKKEDDVAESPAEAPDGGKPGSESTKEEKNGLGSKLKGFWTGLGLDFPTLITMAKGGMPPAIALAMCGFRTMSLLEPRNTDVPIGTSQPPWPIFIQHWGIS